MAPKVGFILLTHDKPSQAIRLVTTLNRMFDCPPIVCHNDFSRTNLIIDTLPDNFSIVRPHIQTAWGRFSLVEAVLRALQVMYESKTAPDWFILLSGADYPIKPARLILQDLDSSLFDVHINNVELKYNSYQNYWQKNCYNRYCGINLWFPFVDRKFHLTRRKITISNPLLVSRFLPFSDELRCFAGEFWFCANRKSAEYLIRFYHERPALAAHYRNAKSPSESYFQTVFCNAPELKVSGNNWRYVDWSKEGPHPKTLLREDLPKFSASSAHFARKFDVDVDAMVFNDLDTIVGV
jgi:Core-2/I-Branching enzyme